MSLRQAPHPEWKQKAVTERRNDKLSVTPAFYAGLGKYLNREEYRRAYRTRGRSPVIGQWWHNRRTTRREAA